MPETIINLLNSSEKVCLLVKNSINSEYCDELLTMAGLQGFDQAIDKYPSTYRNNQRLQLDSVELAEGLFDACGAYFPKELDLEKAVYELDSLNPRLRFCKYQNEQWFKIHQDGEYSPSTDKCSKLTFLLYLNDASEFAGGNTNFYSDQYGNELLASYRPKKGDLLIFSHDIWHSGETVKQGTKYILRSDVIYKTKTTKENKQTHHDGYIWKIHALDEQCFATVSRDKRIKIWDKNSSCLESLETHENSVLDIAHDTEKNLYGVSRDGYISKWCTENGTYQLSYKVDSGHPTVLSINIFGDHCVTTGSDGKIRKFDLAGNLLCESSELCDWHWKLIKYQKMYLTCNTDGCLYFWDTDTLSLSQKFSISEEALTCLTLYKHFVYIGTLSGDLIQFYLLTSNIVKKWSAHTASVRDITLDDCGNIYTCGEDNKVKKFSPVNLSSETITIHAGFATSIMLSCKSIYSVSYDGSIICSGL